MPRAKTGTAVRTKAGHWQPVVTIPGPDGKPTRRRLQVIPGESKAKAKERARYWSQRFEAEGVTRPEPTRKRKAQRVPAAARPPKAGRGASAPTVPPASAEAEVWWRAFLEERSTRIKGRDKAVGHYRHHLPHTGILDQHPRDWTADDLRAVVRYLDERAADPGVKFGPKTAINVWTTVQAACKAAHKSKRDDLRCRGNNPSRDVAGPDRGVKKAKPIVYPAELVRFAACEAVPLEWRRVIVVAAYLYCRPGELVVLRWRDVDLERGVVRFHRAWDEKAAGAKETKTNHPRTVAIEPTLLPLLRAMRRERPEAELVAASEPGRLDGHDLHHLAKPFRDALLAAGIDRPELHEAEATSMASRFRTLRDTGITWRAVRGDEAHLIMAAAGHKGFATTQGYIGEASAYLTNREAFGEPFPPLPAEVLGDDPELEAIARNDHRANSSTNLCEGGDSKRHPLREDSRSTRDDGGSAVTTRDQVAGSPRGDRNVAIASDPVEAALGEGLRKAADAGRWDVVSQLARELETRRKAREGAGNVVSIEAAKDGRR